MGKKVSKTGPATQVRKKPLTARIWEHRWFYVMFLPVFIFVFMMMYMPMFGIRYAFYDYKPVGEPVFVGMKHFIALFQKQAFWTAFINT